MSLPDSNIDVNIDFRDLVCPLGKFPLKAEGENLVCTNCGARFPVVEGIPVLLIDDAVLPENISSITELKCYTK